jgi:ubiquinone/menaquinone biosynthesis C-methylase UbiE
MMAEQNSISRVNRSKGKAGRFYDRISRSYDWLGGFFERRPAGKALQHLKIQSGEAVLEIGSGAGYCLKLIASSVGRSGKVFSIDLSAGMIHQAGKRLAHSSLSDRVELCRGDAAWLPFADTTFDAVFLSFTLELFDTPEIPEVLAEIKRVLKPGGRLGLVGLSKIKERSLAVNLYEWAHNRWPDYIDCRPIYPASAIRQAGFKIILNRNMRLVVLPVEIVIALK